MRRVLTVLLLSLTTACFTDEAPVAEEPADAPAADATADAGPTDAEFAACFARHSEVSRALVELARARASPCVTNADCTEVRLLIPCMDACTQVVAASRSAEFIAARDAYGAAVCPGLPRICGITPACVPLTPVCDQGMCRGSLPCAGVSCGPALPPLTLDVVVPAGRTLGDVQLTGAVTPLDGTPGPVPVTLGANASCGAAGPGAARCHVQAGAGAYVLDVQAQGYGIAHVEVTVPASKPAPGQCCAAPYVPQSARVELRPAG